MVLGLCNLVEAVLGDPSDKRIGLLRLAPGACDARGVGGTTGAVEGPGVGKGAEGG